MTNYFILMNLAIGQTTYGVTINSDIPTPNGHQKHT